MAPETPYKRGPNSKKTFPNRAKPNTTPKYANDQTELMSCTPNQPTRPTRPSPNPPSLEKQLACLMGKSRGAGAQGGRADGGSATRTVGVQQPEWADGGRVRVSATHYHRAKKGSATRMGRRGMKGSASSDSKANRVQQPGMACGEGEFQPPGRWGSATGEGGGIESCQGGVLRR